MLVVNYVRGKNSVVGNPRIVVKDVNDYDTFQKVVSQKGTFRTLKNNRTVSVANAGWVYAVCNNTVIDFNGVKVKFIKQD